MATAELATDLAFALDPVAMLEHTGFYPDLWQRDVLRSTSRRLLLDVTRQGGEEYSRGRPRLSYRAV